MDRSRVAEWILGCVLPAERAAAVVGDFLEDAGARGRLWFWSSVLRTVVARVVNDFSERPFAMIGIGVAGFLRNAAFTVPPLLALVVFDVVEHRLPMMVNVAPPGQPPHTELMWQINWALNILWAIWLFQCGRWAARKLPGLEVAAGVAVGAAGWAAILACWIYFRIAAPSAHITPGLWHDLPLIAGGVWQRRQRLAYGS